MRILSFLLFICLLIATARAEELSAEYPLVSDPSSWIGTYEGRSSLFAKCWVIIEPNQSASELGTLDFHLYYKNSHIPFWNFSQDLDPALTKGTNPVAIEEPRRCGMGCVSGQYFISIGKTGLPARFSGVLKYFHGIEKQFDCKKLRRLSTGSDFR